jgi:hypothetical protein
MTSKHYPSLQSRRDAEQRRELSKISRRSGRGFDTCKNVGFILDDSRSMMEMTWPLVEVNFALTGDAASAIPRPRSPRSCADQPSKTFASCRRAPLFLDLLLLCA